MPIVSDYDKYVVLECPFCKELIIDDHTKTNQHSLDLILKEYRQHLKDSEFCKKRNDNLPPICEPFNINDEDFKGNLINLSDWK